LKDRIARKIISKPAIELITIVETINLFLDDLSDSIFAD
jgi:hypothetical protein